MFVNVVVIKDVAIVLFKKGYVLDMVHLVPRAVTMDAPIKPRKEDYVLDMVQR